MAVASLEFVEATVGRHEEAHAHLNEARPVGEQFDNAYVIAASRMQLGIVALARGELDGRQANSSMKRSNTAWPHTAHKT